MKILCISGSVRKGSTTLDFLKAIEKSFSQKEFDYFDISAIPLFHPDISDHNDLKEVRDFKIKIDHSDAIIFATPEYLHNIPAVLKSALEWTTESGELADKKVIALTYTPHPPRGEKALQGLLNSLKALNAQVIVGESFYHNALNADGILNNEYEEIFQSVFDMLE